MRKYSNCTSKENKLTGPITLKRNGLTLLNNLLLLLFLTKRAPKSRRNGRTSFGAAVLIIVLKIEIFLKINFPSSNSNLYGTAIMGEIQ